MKSDLEISFERDEIPINVLCALWHAVKMGVFFSKSDTPFADMYTHEECSFAYGDLDLLDSIYRGWRDGVVEAVLR